VGSSGKFRHTLLPLGQTRPTDSSSISTHTFCVLFPLQLGLIDESEFERKKKKSQWAGRYNERVNESTLVGADLAEGEEGDNYDPAPVMDPEEVARRKKAGLWTRREEEYYNEGKCCSLSCCKSPC
jgi:hypothetical protein